MNIELNKNEKIVGLFAIVIVFRDNDEPLDPNVGELIISPFLIV